MAREDRQLPVTDPLDAAERGGEARFAAHLTQASGNPLERQIVSKIYIDAATWAVPTFRPLDDGFQIQSGLVRSRGCGNRYKYLSTAIRLPLIAPNASDPDAPERSRVERRHPIQLPFLRPHHTCGIRF